MWKNKEKPSSISSRTRRTAVRILACWYRWSYFIRFFKTDMMEWNCSSFAGSIFGKSSETLLNLVIVCFVNRSNFQFGNAFAKYFSSPNTRSTGKFVWSTISTPRFWFKFSNYSRNGIIWPTILTGHWNMQRRRYPIGNSAFWHDIQCPNSTRFQTI